MEEKTTLAIIGSLAAILGALGLPKLWESVCNYFTKKLDTKHHNVKNLNQRIDHQKEIIKQQAKEIDLLKDQLEAMRIRMDVIIPILEDKFKDDPKTLDLLAKLIQKKITNEKVA